VAYFYLKEAYICNIFSILPEKRRGSIAIHGGEETPQSS
jgi:hypothetical protein